jgi:hypothetical protein
MSASRMHQNLRCLLLLPFFDNFFILLCEWLRYIQTCELEIQIDNLFREKKLFAVLYSNSEMLLQSDGNNSLKPDLVSFLSFSIANLSITPFVCSHPKVDDLASEKKLTFALRVQSVNDGSRQFLANLSDLRNLFRGRPLYRFDGSKVRKKISFSFFADTGNIVQP